MQICVISSWNTSLNGSQTQPVVLCMQNGVISTWNTCLYGSQPSSVVFACKTATFSLEYKSLWVPDITCRCVHEKSLIRTRISSLYVSQTSSVVLSTHNCVLNTKIKRLCWFQPSPVVLCMQNSDFRTRITSLCGSKTQPVVFECKTENSGPE